MPGQRLRFLHVSAALDDERRVRYAQRVEVHNAAWALSPLVHSRAFEVAAKITGGVFAHD